MRKTAGFICATIAAVSMSGFVAGPAFADEAPSTPDVTAGSADIDLDEIIGGIDLDELFGELDLDELVAGSSEVDVPDLDLGDIADAVTLPGSTYAGPLYVGQNGIQAGTYQTTAPYTGCFYLAASRTEVLNANSTGNVYSLMNIVSPGATATAELSSGDAFLSFQCGTWTKIADPAAGGSLDLNIFGS